jgi:hypothetical protein
MTRPATNATRRNGTVRCAIYTRKSSEEGLEQWRPVVPLGDAGTLTPSSALPKSS